MDKKEGDTRHVELNLLPISQHTNPISWLIERLTERVLESYDSLDWESVYNSFEIPDKKFGDLSTNLSFLLAKELKRSPVDVAKELARLFEDLDEVEVSTIGPYVNLTVTDEFLLMFLREAISRPTGYRSNGTKVLIEYPSVNPNKPWHVGHLRNALLGDVVSNVFEYLGYSVVRMDYIDDLGLQVAENIYSYLTTKDQPTPNEKFDHWAGKEYVKIHSMFESNPKVQEEVRGLMKRLEEKDPEVWTKAVEFVDRCVRAQYDTAYRYQVYHDCMIYESDVLDVLYGEGITLLKENEVIAHVEEGELKGCYVAKTPFGDKVLIRSDGTITYTGKDVIFHLWKFGILKNDFKYDVFDVQPNGLPVYRSSRDGVPQSYGHADMIINVIGIQQDYPQKVVRHVLERLGYTEAAKGYYHLGYELVRLSSESFSGRRGTWKGYTADELYEEGKKRVLDILKERDYDPMDKELIADAITNNAIRYSFLRVSPEKVIIFDWDRTLNMEGDSGPYLTYAYVRAVNIIKRMGVISLNLPEKYKFNEYERALLIHLIRFNQVVEKTARELRPNILIDYLTHLVSEYNRFYENCPVLSAEEDLIRNIRVGLVLLTSERLRTGLSLLGMTPIDRM